MNVNWLKNMPFAAILLGCFMLFTAAAVAEGAPSATVQDSSTVGKVTTLKIKLDDLKENQRCRDLHITPPPTDQFPKPKIPEVKKVTITPKGGGDSQTWSAKNDAGQLHIGTPWDDTDTGLEDGEYTIEITWKGSKIPDGTEVTFQFTDNGFGWYQDPENEPDQTPKPKYWWFTHRDVFAIVVGGKAKIPLIGMTLSDMTLDEPFICSRGCDTPLVLGVDPVVFTGCTFEIFTSLTENPDFEDLLQIGINSVVDPIPLPWGIEVLNSEGTIGSDGWAMIAPMVRVPAGAPIPPNSTFYMVFVLYDQYQEVIGICPASMVVIP